LYLPKELRTLSMKWQDIENSSPSEFKRLVGVGKDLFKEMTDEALRLAPQSTHKVTGAKRGPKPKLSMENQVLMLLMYYREYRTYLHIAKTFGVSEAQCWRIITGLEKTLLKSGLFHLKGKKRLLSEDSFEVVLIDVAESPIERPKKSKENIIQGKRKGIP
jgi:hypothetical protein